MNEIVSLVPRALYLRPRACVVHLIQIPDTAVKSIKHDALGTKEFHS
jgi:hypothetical protein